MRYKRLWLWMILIGLLSIAAGRPAYAITVDEAMEKLKTHKFGQNDDVLNFLYESAIGSHSDAALRKKLNDGFRRVLESNAAYDAKQFACRQLALTATTAHIPVLAKHLTDEKMSHIVLYVLRHIDSPEVDKVLLLALDKASGRAKLGIISMLGNRRSVAAIGPLGKLIVSGDQEVALESIKALGRIGTKSAHAQFALMDVAKEPTGVELLAVGHALLDFGERLADDGEAKLAQKAYQTAFDVHYPGPIRAAALRGLAEVMGDKAESYVGKALKSDDEDLYDMAVVIIRNTQQKRNAEAMAAELGSLKPKVQLLLINALAARSDGAGLDLVKEACRSDGVDVRITALRALSRFGDASTIALLIEHAAASVGGERAAAQESLAGLKGPKVNSILIRQLGGGDSASKAVICRALLGRNAVEAAPALVKAARVDSGRVRGEALKALRDLAGEKEIPSLVDLVFVVEPTEADEVGKALSAVARRHSVHRQCTENILSKLNQAKNERQRVALLTTLGGLGHELGLVILRAGLDDKSDEIRYAAIKALSVWPNDAPAGDLAKVVETTKNRTHRILALRGYIDLVDSASLPVEKKLEHYRRAMQLADQNTEKKKVLSSLARLDSPAAFETAASLVDDAALKDEAALAACAVAQKIYTSKGQQIKGQLEKIVAADLSDSTRQQAWDILGGIEQVKYYVSDWEVSGPYLQEGKDYSALFDTAFAPEIDGGKDAKWRRMPAGTDPAQPYYLDLLKALNGGEQRVAYLRTKLQWPKEQQVKLWIGSDDGNKVWVNGKLVHSNNVARAFTVDQDSAAAALKKGENVIMMKITQNNLPWGASLRIEEPRPPKPPKLGKGFKLHVINGESAFEAAGVCDINKDGKLDIVSGGFWYEGPSWKKHFIREVQYDGNYYYDFASLPMDVDGDGWVDIVSVAWHNKKVFWVRNPGGSGGKFEVFDVDAPGNMETAIAVDIDGDGRLDILPNIMTAAAWYEYQADAAAASGVKWTKHVLPQQVAGHGIGAGDVNGDGRCDVVAPNGWAEQTADGNWQWRSEFGLGTASIPILVHDVDGDGDGDIVWGMGHDYGIFWLEQGKDDDGKRTWTKHEIDSQWSQPHFLIFADLDNDGEDELITGKRVHAHNGHDPGGNEPPCVYYYSFEKDAKKWSRHILHEGGKVGFGINTQVVDIDGDGDIDIVAPGKTGLYLFENMLVK